MPRWTSIEEQIQKAMQEGKFDNLPGKGRRLKLDENPLEDPEWRLAHRALREAGYSLPWIERNRQIEQQTERAREALRRTWNWRQSAHGRDRELAEAEWKRALAAFRASLEEINRQIDAYNLEAPLLRFQRPRLNPEREIQSLTS